jgi:hypothetical protein
MVGLPLCDLLPDPGHAVSAQPQKLVVHEVALDHVDFRANPTVIANDICSTASLRNNVVKMGCAI